MFSSDKVPSKIEEIVDSRVSTNESLSLNHRFELPHPSLPDPGRLMGLLCPIVGVLIGDMDRFRDHITMGDWITSSFISRDLPGFTAMVSQQPLEKPFSRYTIPLGL